MQELCSMEVGRRASVTRAFTEEEVPRRGDCEQEDGNCGDRGMIGLRTEDLWTRQQQVSGQCT